MKKTIKFPINIAPAQGGYALELEIGSQKKVVQLLIDTGSSTIAFNSENYSPEEDTAVSYSQFAQCVTYGKGGWAGPVLHTEITYANGTDSFELDKAPFAIVSNIQEQSFLGLDGILGLAYHHLNDAHELSEYYKDKGQADGKTYAWTFTDEVNKNGMPAFKKFLNKYPEKDITPIFTAFEQQYSSLHQFALLTHRSVVYVPTENMTEQQKENEPLNQGHFIIGDVEQDKELCNGVTQDIKVLHDAYYNTNLLSIQVEGFDSVTAPPLEETKTHSYFTNSIIDSGSSYLMLQNLLYQYVIDSLNKINSKLVPFIDGFNQAMQNGKPYMPTDLDLNGWPNLYFTFEGADGKPIKLCCSPDHYWQLHAGVPDRVFFTLLKQIKDWPNQSVIGLPLISSYLCIFDRSAGTDGVIKFAKKDLL
jgi:hypothetical protein